MKDATNKTARHTPGPWSYGWVGNVGTPGLGASCVGTSGTCDWVGPIGADADARLIASAPDLLAALEEIADCPPPLSVDTFRRMIEVARTALARAKGGA